MNDKLKRPDGDNRNSASLRQLWRRAFVTIAAIELLVSYPSSVWAAATLTADRNWSQVKGWAVYWNAQNDSCFAERAQTDGTHVLVGLLDDGSRFVLGFSNDSLSFATEGKSYKLKFSFDNRPSRGSGMTAYDFRTGKLLLGIFDDASKLRTQTAKSGKLTIRHGKTTLATIVLPGIGAALEAIDTCRRAAGDQANISADESKEITETLAEADNKSYEADGKFNAGNYSSAELLYRTALAIRVETLGTEHKDVALSFDKLATLLVAKGDLAGAEPLYRRALAIAEKVLGPQHAEVGASLNNLAKLLVDKGDLASAEPLFRRALAIQELALGPEHPDVNIVLNNLALLLKTKGDLAGAEPLYRRSLANIEKAHGAEHRDLAIGLINLAALLQAKGNFGGAEPLYRRAIAIGEKELWPGHPDLAVILDKLATLLHEKGDLAGAEPMHRRALAIRERALGPDHVDVGQSLNNLAITLKDKGDLAGSLDLARKAAQGGHPRRKIYLSALFAAEAELPAITPESFEVVQRTAASEAGSALNSLALRALAGEEKLSVQVRREQDLTVELAKLDKAILNEVSKEPAQRVTANEDAIRARTAALTAERTQVREIITIAFPDYAELSRPQTLGLAEAQQLLADDEALVVIDAAGKGQGDDYVWAVTRSIADWKRLDTRQGEIAQSLATMRAGLDLSEPGRASIDTALAHQFYKKLLGQVETTLAGKSHLIFVLNGAVSSLPPQVLVSEPPTSKDMRNAHWLVRDHAVTVLPTVSSLKLLRAKTNITKAEKPFIGFGDPVFDPKIEGEIRMADRAYRSFFRGSSTDIEALKAGLPRLPGTGKELQAVAKSLGADASHVVLRAAANEAAVKKAKLTDYNIVYFATHGLVAGEVESVGKAGAEPALALTIPDKASDLNDGLLTASEVAGLKLNADWVVLSACNTAAEGKPGAPALSGLARAFFYSGARSLLVSHWVVDDDATAELMSRTFAYAATHPERRQAEALRQAMLSIMDDTNHPQWADPGYWAAFVLVGEAK